MNEPANDVVTRRLADSFPNLMSYSFTAEMETELDKIAGGDKACLVPLRGGGWVRV